MKHIGQSHQSRVNIIMRTSTFCSLVAVSAAIFAMPLVVSAQTGSSYGAPAKNIAPPPPETQPLEEGQGPSVNIRQPDTQKRITEKKSQGRVTEVKVETGKTTYYAHPNDPGGSALPGDAQSSTTRPVQFQIGEFGKPKTKPEPEPVQTLQPNPNPVK
jgi:hypothetical protein